MSLSARHSVVIAFPPPARPNPNRLSTRDRIEALRWAELARGYGYPRVVLESCDEAPDADLGDYLMVYRRDAVWASWGIGCVADGFMLWRPETGATIGHFATLGAALETILARS
jgi:hypothetical protein